ncbi:MAG: glycosyltransferase [Gemmatales bacterium]|nr:glycosyltransferase [Gemmatales bacterium]MDW8386383.1 glycosyltransferase [Gemmatales bacterium]
MNILFVTSRPEFGTDERSLAVLLRGLLQAGFHVEIACLGAVESLAERVRADGVPIHVLANRLGDPRWFVRLRRLIAEMRPDVIHAWDPISHLLTRISVLGQPEMPILVTQAGRLETRLPWPRWLSSLRIWKADAVVEPSVAAEPHLAVRSRQALNIPEDAPLVLAVGRLSTDYAFRDALWAFDILKYVQPQAILAVLGDGPQRPKLERFAVDIRLGNQVRFLGEVRDPVIWLSAADVVCVPHVGEEVPVGLLEAMALEKPIVALAAKSVTTLVEDGKHALLVPLGDKPALAKATLRLLENPELARNLAAAARKLAQERFSPTKMIDRYVVFYRSLSTPTPVKSWAVRTARLTRSLWSAPHDDKHRRLLHHS